MLKGSLNAYETALQKILITTNTNTKKDHTNISLC